MYKLYSTYEIYVFAVPPSSLLAFSWRGWEPCDTHVPPYQRPNSWTKSRQSFKRFPPCYSCSLYSFALRFLSLQTHATSYSFRCALLYSVKKKVEEPDRKPHPLPRNPYRNLKCENSQNYAQKPQRNCTFMNSASALVLLNFHKQNFNISSLPSLSSEDSFLHLKYWSWGSPEGWGEVVAHIWQRLCYCSISKIEHMDEDI